MEANGALNFPNLIKVLPAECGNGPMPYQSCILQYDMTVHQELAPAYEYPELPYSAFLTIEFIDPCVPPVFIDSSGSITTYTAFSPYLTVTTLPIELNNNLGICGDYTDYYLIPITAMPSDSSVISFPSTQPWNYFNIYTNNLAQVGTYSFNLSRGLVDYAAFPEYTYNLTYTVHILDPCESAAYSRQQPPTTYINYIIGDSSRSYTLPQFTTTTPTCGNFNYLLTDQYGAEYLYSAIMFSFPTLTIYTANILPSWCFPDGIYKLSCQMVLELRAYQGTYSDKLAPLPTNSTTAPYILLEIADPCYGVVLSPLHDWTFSHSIGPDNTTYTLQQVNSISTNGSINACGQKQFSIFFTSDHYNQRELIVLDNQYNIVTLRSQNLSDVGIITGYIEYNLTKYTSLYYPQFSSKAYFSAEFIDPCLSATYSVPKNDKNYTLYIRHGTLFITFTEFTSDVLISICGDFVYEVTNLDGTELDSSIFAIDLFHTLITAQSSSPLPMQYGGSRRFDIQIRGYQSGYPSMIQPTSGSVLLTSVTVIDTCYGASISASNFNSTTAFYIVGNSPRNLFFSNFSVTDSLGYTGICDPPVYSLSMTSQADLTSEIFTMNNAKSSFVSVYSKEQNAKGVYNLTISGQLSDYPTIEASFSKVFAVCNIEVEDLSPRIYLIGTSPQLIQIPSPFAGQNSLCPSIPYSFSQDDSLIDSSMITVNSSSITIYTADTSKKGTYSINYTINFGSVSGWGQMLLLLQCNSLSLTPPTFINQIYMVGGNSLTYRFKDYTQFPLCKNRISYQATMANGDDLPIFITFNPTSRQFTVISGVLQNSGFYTIKIIASSQNSDGSMKVDDSGSFKLQMIMPPLQISSQNQNSTSSAEIDYSDYEWVFDSTGILVMKKKAVQTQQVIKYPVSNELKATISKYYVQPLESISCSGLMEIDFTPDILVPTNLSSIDNSTLNITLIPLTNAEGDDLSFTWKAVSITPSKMMVQMNFKSPLEVSVSICSE